MDEETRADNDAALVLVLVLGVVPCSGLRSVGARVVGEALVVAQQLPAQLTSGSQDDRVRQAQTVMASAELGGTLGRLGVKGIHADTHRSNRPTGITGAAYTREGHQRFAVSARRDNEVGRRLVSGFDVVDSALMVVVCSVEQPDEDAGVKDQRSHSSRSRSSSPGR